MAKQIEQKYSRQRKTMRASRLTQGILSPALRRQGFTQSEIITRWPLIVGKDMAESAVPIKINFRPGARRDGILSVRAESAFAPILQHRIPQIIAAVNQYYGYGAIADVKIIQGPLPKKRVYPTNQRKEVSGDVTSQVTEIIGETRDENLRDALQHLGEQMLSDGSEKQ